MALTNSRYCSPRRAARQANLGSGGGSLMLSPYLLSVGSLAALGLLLACDQTASVSPSVGAASIVAADFSGPRPWKESYQSSGDHRPCYPVPVYAPSGERSRHRHRDSHREIHHRQLSLRRSQYRRPDCWEFVKTTANGDQPFRLIRRNCDAGSAAGTDRNLPGERDGHFSQTEPAGPMGPPAPPYGGHHAGRLLPDSGSNSDRRDMTGTISYSNIRAREHALQTNGG